MEIEEYPIRDEQVVWQNVGDEVVIADIEGNTLRILNETAGFIWTLADGTRKIEDIAREVFDRFDVTPEQARADVIEFCQELLQSGLIKFEDDSQRV